MLATRAQRHAFFVWNLQKDVGMTCGGEVKLYFEAQGTKTWDIAVFGAGHVAQALVPLLCTLECRVHCFDPRSEWIEPLPSHPKLLKKVSADPKAEVVALPPETFFVLISQGHATDLPVLREVLTTRNAPFVGVIGSDSKRRILQKELRESGVREELLDQFLCPIGLPIGNSSPSEIAVSIAAQLLERRDQPSSSDQRM
jgi:xanthine dehydrogenase accessory factor